jgi:hypothetical protein
VTPATTRTVEQTTARWLVEAAAAFVATWIAVGGIAVAMTAILGGDFSPPNTVEEVLSVPFVLLAILVISMLTATFAFALYSFAAVPSLAVYLAALRLASSVGLRGRVVAVALSPLCIVLLLVGGWDVLDPFGFALLVGAVVFGLVVRLPPRPR